MTNTAPGKNTHLDLVPWNPYSIARMIWKQGLLVLGTFAAVLVAAGVIIARLPDVYRAEAVVLVDSQKIPEKFVASTVQVSLQDSLNSISQRVLNASRLQTLIKDFHLYQAEWGKASQEELVDLFRKDLTVTLERGLSGNRSGAFRISFDGKTPQEVADVVGRITDLFVSENVTTRAQRAEGTAEFLDSQLQIAKKRLDEQEAALSTFKMAHVGQLPQQEGALLGALGRLQAELQGNQDAINRSQQNKVLLESTLKFAEAAMAGATRQLGVQGPVATVRSQTTADSAETLPATKSSDVLRARLDALRIRYLEDHPEVRRAQAELDHALAEEAKAPPPAASRRTDVGDTVAVPVRTGNEQQTQALAELNRERERIASTRAQIESINRDIQSRTAARDQIEKSISQYQARVESLPLREQQMASLTRDYETSKLAYQSLLDKKIAATIATDMERSDNSERFTVADPARRPTKPVKPKRGLYLFMAGVGALALGLSLALAVEVRRNRVLGEWELPTQVRVLARIPIMPASRGVQ